MDKRASLRWNFFIGSHHYFVKRAGKILSQRRSVGSQIFHCSFEARLDSLVIMFFRSPSVIEPHREISRFVR